MNRPHGPFLLKLDDVSPIFILFFKCGHLADIADRHLKDVLVRHPDEGVQSFGDDLTSFEPWPCLRLLLLFLGFNQLKWSMCRLERIFQTLLGLLSYFLLSFLSIPLGENLLLALEFLVHLCCLHRESFLAESSMLQLGLQLLQSPS